jgi:hypothetical protein
VVVKALPYLPEAEAFPIQNTRSQTHLTRKFHQLSSDIATMKRPLSDSDLVEDQVCSQSRLHTAYSVLSPMLATIPQRNGLPLRPFVTASRRYWEGVVNQNEQYTGSQNCNDNGTGDNSAGGDNQGQESISDDNHSDIVNHGNPENDSALGEDEKDFATDTTSIRSSDVVTTERGRDYCEFRGKRETETSLEPYFVQSLKLTSCLIDKGYEYPCDEVCNFAFSLTKRRALLYNKLR